MADVAPVLRQVDKRHGGIKKSKLKYPKSIRIEPTLTKANGDSQVNKEEIFYAAWGKVEKFLQETFVPAEQLQMPCTDKYLDLVKEVQNICLASVRRGICPGFHRYDMARVELPRRLYANLKSFLQDHLHRIGAAGAQLRDNKEILNFYSKQCHDYDVSSKILNGICQYLNRNWITQERMAKQNGIRHIYELALCTWRDTLFEHLNGNVTQAILDIINIDRNSGTNQFTHVADIKEVIKSYTNIGKLYEDDSTDKYLFIYCQHFENQFLEATRAYYAAKLNEILNAQDPEFSILKIEEIVMQEEARVRETLDGSTLKKVVRVCVETLALDHVELLYRVFQNLLERKNERGLRSFYQIIKRISPQHVSEMADRFQRIVAEIAKEQLSIEGNPDEFCKKMFGLITAYQEVIRVCFEQSMEFSQAMDQACLNFVNSDRGSLRKLPDHLARYTHNLLGNTSKRGGSMTDQEVQEKLDEALKLIPLINDKDLLGRHLKHYYGNRLLWGSSRSLEIEEKFVNALTEPLSRDYSRRLLQMYKDTVHLSKTLTKEFNDQLKAPLGYTFQAYVLAAGSWSYPIEQSDFIFPEVFHDAMTQFTTFYNSKTGEKKLVWIPYKAGGELKFHTGDKLYQISASTYEMTILLLYNNADEYKMDALKEATKLEDDKLEQVIANLIHTKILKLITPNFPEGKIEPRPPAVPAAVFISRVINEIQKNREKAVIKFNDQYKPPNFKTKYNLPIKADVCKEEQKLENDIKLARRYSIQAILVRIMKEVKKLGKQTLIIRATEECQKTYKYFPTYQDVQIQLATLIKENYMNQPANRDDPNGEITYVA